MTESRARHLQVGLPVAIHVRDGYRMRARSAGVVCHYGAEGPVAKAQQHTHCARSRDPIAICD